MFEMKMPKMDLASSTFVPAFTYSVSEPSVTITNLPITDPRIPTLVESIGQQQPASLSSGSPHGCGIIQEQPLYLNMPSPATGLSQLKINSPQALSPNPSNVTSSTSSPQRTISPNCPPSSPYMPKSPNLQRNQQENQALNEQNINDFIKSILAPDTPGLSDLGSNIFFDGSTQSGTVCVDSEGSQSVDEGKKTEEKKFFACKEGEPKEQPSKKDDIAESMQKLDITQ